MSTRQIVIPSVTCQHGTNKKGSELAGKVLSWQWPWQPLDGLLSPESYCLYC